MELSEPLVGEWPFCFCLCVTLLGVLTLSPHTDRFCQMLQGTVQLSHSLSFIHTSCKCCSAVLCSQECSLASLPPAGEDGYFFPPSSVCLCQAAWGITGGHLFSQWTEGPWNQDKVWFIVSSPVSTMMPDRQSSDVYWIKKKQKTEKQQKTP